MTPEFDAGLATLLDCWRAYDDAPRDPARVVELTAAWAALDDARRAVRSARPTLSLPRPALPLPRPTHLAPRPAKVAVDEVAYQWLAMRNQLPRRRRAAW